MLSKIRLHPALTLTLLAVLILFTAAFQNILPVPGTEDPNANVSYPPPVYTLRGQIEVRGTVNLPQVTRYYLEARPLSPDGSELGTEQPWLPITLPSNVLVIDNVLGVWDTNLLPDGLYEMRLTVEVTGVAPRQSVVSPLRIENEIPPFVTVVAPVATEASNPGVVPTTAPVNSGAPIGTATINGNVRTGDSTAFPVITSLRPGETVELIGMSNSGSGWYQVRLPDGRIGFAAPSILSVSGNTSGLPLVAPPPVPTLAATAVPPTAVASLPDAALTNVRFDRELHVNQPFQIFLTLVNTSPVALPPIAVACNFTPMNQIFSVTTGGLAGNSQVDVAITAQLTSGGGANVTANCAADLNNLVAETNESNNYYNVTVMLNP